MSQSFGSFAKQHLKSEGKAFGKELTRQLFGKLNTKPKCKCKKYKPKKFKPKQKYKPFYNFNKKKY